MKCGELLLVLGCFSAFMTALTMAQPGPLKLNLYTSPLLVNEAVRERASADLVDNQRNNLEGKPGQGYYLSVLIGTPPQPLNVLVDTGSSNFAVAAAENTDITKYFQSQRSSTFREKGATVFVPYTQGNWKGQLGNDLVSLPSLPNTTIRADLVSIDSSEKFFINGSNWQGILGMAYAAIARPDDSVEPFFDAFTKQTGMANVFSMQLCGSVNSASQVDDVEMGGSMILGGIDHELFTEPILYSPIYKEWYYEIIIADVLVNDQSLNMDCKEYNFDKTIVDSGTTNLRLPQKVFDRLVTTLKLLTTLPETPPADFWSGVDILCWPKLSSPLDLFPDVKLALLMAENQTFHLVISPQQYLRTIGDHLSQQTNPGQDCFKFAIAPSTTGTVIGAVIMEGYYVIFDREKASIGWAETRCLNARQNTLRISRMEGPFTANASRALCFYEKPDSTLPESMAIGISVLSIFLTVASLFCCSLIVVFVVIMVSVEVCAYVTPRTNQATLAMVAYIMAGICGLCVVPVLVALIQWQINRWRHKTADVHGLLTNVAA